MLKRIDDPRSFLHESGGLHDAEITQLHWDITKRAVSILVDDLNANFSGLPEYQGRCSGRLIFESVTAFESLVKPTTGQWHIYGMEVARDDGSLRFTIRCSPGGRIVISCGQFAIERQTD